MSQSTINPVDVTVTKPSILARAQENIKAGVQVLKDKKDQAVTKISEVASAAKAKASEAVTTVKTKASEGVTAAKAKAAALKAKAVEVLGDIPANAKAAAASTVNISHQHSRARRALTNLTRLGLAATKSPASIRMQDGEGVVAYTKRLFNDFSATPAEASTIKKTLAKATGALKTYAAMTFNASGVAGNFVFRVVNNLSVVIGPLGSGIAVLAGLITRAIVLTALVGSAIAAATLAATAGMASVATATALVAITAAIALPVVILKGDTLFLAVQVQELKKKVIAQEKKTETPAPAVVPATEPAKTEETPAPAVVETPVKTEETPAPAVVETPVKTEETPAPVTTPVNSSEESEESSEESEVEETPAPVVAEPVKTEEKAEGFFAHLIRTFNETCEEVQDNRIFG